MPTQEVTPQASKPEVFKPEVFTKFSYGGVEITMPAGKHAEYIHELHFGCQVEAKDILKPYMA